MVLYDAVVVVKRGRQNSQENILYASLSGLYKEDYIKSCLVKKIAGNLIISDDKYNKWSETYEGIWDVKNLPPLYAFHDREKLRIYFNLLFNTLSGDTSREYSEAQILYLNNID